MNKEQTYEAEYLRRDRNSAVINYNFAGAPIEMIIPYSIIKNSGLKEGDKFKFTVGEDYKIDPSSLELIEPKPWSEKQKKEIIRFFEKSLRIHNKRLEDLSSE